VAIEWNPTTGERNTVSLARLLLQSRQFSIQVRPAKTTLTSFTFGRPPKILDSNLTLNPQAPQTPSSRDA
jgi:hypothetical protein